MIDRAAIRARSVAYAWPAITAALALLLASSFFDSALLDPGSWPSLLATMMPFMLVAIAQVPAVVAGGGGVDLSVGPTAGFVNVIVVEELVRRGIEAPYEVLPIALACGALIGLVNGVLVAYVRIAPIVATLGTYLFLSGYAIYLLPNAGGSAPPFLSRLDGSVGGLPGTVFLLIGAACFWQLLMRSAFRRNLYAVGCDDRAAFTAGVPVAQVRALAYVCSGVFASLAGLAFTVVLGSADPTVAPPYTLLSLAGVALGGVALAGGRGGVLGAAAGGAILFLIQHLLDVVGVQAFYAQVTYGAMLIVALAFNSFAEARRRARRGEERRPLSLLRLLLREQELPAGASSEL